MPSPNQPVPSLEVSLTTLSSRDSWAPKTRIPVCPLRVLSASDTHITDAALAHLKSPTKLRVIDLQDTLVGDVGLLHLQTLAEQRVLPRHCHG